MTGLAILTFPRASHRPAKSRVARPVLSPAVTMSAPADVVQLSVRGSDMHPRFRDNSSVSSVDYMLDRLSAAERGSKPQVRRAVARRIGIAPGTVENLRRGRIKFGLSVFRGWNDLRTSPHVDQLQRLEGLSRDSE